MDLVLLINTCIFFVLECTLGIGGQEQVLQIFKHVFGSLVDLFNSCQIHISYMKYEQIMKKMKIWKNLIKEKVCRSLPGDMGEGVF